MNSSILQILLKLVVKAARVFTAAFQIFNLFLFNSLFVFRAFWTLRKYKDVIKVFSLSYSPVELKGLFSSLYFNPLIKAAALPISRTLLCTLNDALNSPNKRLRAFSLARSRARNLLEKAALRTRPTRPCRGQKAAVTREAYSNSKGP